MRLSLRWKIVGGFGIFLVLIGLLGWVTMSLFNSLRTVQRRVFADAIPALVAVDEIVRSYTAQSASVRGFLIQTHTSLLDQYREEVLIGRRYEDEAMALFTTTAERELLEDLVVAGRDFQELVEKRVVPLASQGNRSQAIRVFSSEGTPLITQIEVLGSQLRLAQDEIVAESQRDVRGNVDRAILILIVVLVGALVLGVILAIVLPRRLSSNLSRLVDAARAIGRGDFNQEIDVRSRDEVGELAARFTEMQAGLKRLHQLAQQDRELEIAATIQRNLLQRSLPRTPGVRIFPLQRQANLVGGDWYDVDLTNDTITIVVGDASGKGIGAALMATVALSVLRVERGLGSPPQRVVTRTNETLIDATDPDSFTTLVYATLDRRTGEMTWLNMGHPSPFILRTDDNGDTTGFFAEGPRNRALGWFEDPGLERNTVRLKPGDRVLMFTDGFLEAKAPEGDVFGEHRLGQAIARLAPLEGPQLAEELVRTVDAYAAGKLDDDLTMLVVEFLGAPDGEVSYSDDSSEEAWHSRR